MTSVPLNNYRKALRTRILECAYVRFRQNGIKAVSMDMLSRELQISKRTMYEIFKDKEELIEASYHYSRSLFRSHFEEFMKTNPNSIEVLVEFFHYQTLAVNEISPQFYHDIEQYPRLKELYEEEKEERLRENTMFYERAMEDGCFRKDINIAIVQRLMEGCIQYVMDKRMYEEFGMKEILYNVITLFIRGLVTTRGLTLLEKCLTDKNIMEEGVGV